MTHLAKRYSPARSSTRANHGHARPRFLLCRVAPKRGNRNGRTRRAKALAKAEAIPVEVEVNSGWGDTTVVVLSCNLPTRSARPPAFEKAPVSTSKGPFWGQIHLRFGVRSEHSTFCRLLAVSFVPPGHTSAFAQRRKRGNPTQSHIAGCYNVADYAGNKKQPKLGVYVRPLSFGHGGPNLRF